MEQRSQGKVTVTEITRKSGSLCLKTKLSNGYEISTVRLPKDAPIIDSILAMMGSPQKGLSSGLPFETLVFDEDYCATSSWVKKYVRRYGTQEEAKLAHEVVVAQVLRDLNESDP